MNMYHDENREREVQALVKYLLTETSPEFWDNPNGPYEVSCPLCLGRVTGGRELLRNVVTMDDIPHEADCPYLIAKDLYIGE